MNGQMYPGSLAKNLDPRTRMMTMKQAGHFSKTEIPQTQTEKENKAARIT